jgi:hypothetical protein
MFPDLQAFRTSQARGGARFQAPVIWQPLCSPLGSRSWPVGYGFVAHIFVLFLFRELQLFVRAAYASFRVQRLLQHGLPCFVLFLLQVEVQEFCESFYRIPRAPAVLFELLNF